MEIIEKIRKTFPNMALFTLALELEELLKGCEEILDLGCGSNSPLSLLSKKKYLVGIDAYKNSIKESKKRQIHDKYFVMDVLKIRNKFKKKSFDAVIALDLIEHLKKSDGIKLLAIIEEIARKKVILLTPNGFINQRDINNNMFQEHLSGWGIRDFKKSGYKVQGKYGLKMLRGEMANLKWKPRFFWGIVSELTHFLYTKKNPEKSFSLLCYKDLS